MIEEKTVFYPQDFFRVQGRGLVVVGELRQGELEPGMKALVQGRGVEVKGLEVFKKRLKKVRAGQKAAKSLGVLIEGPGCEFVKRVVDSKTPIFFERSRDYKRQ